MQTQPTIEIPYEVRPMHVYIPGKTRSGKSTLITHQILADIQNGGGVTLMDGKGDLAPEILDYIPTHRRDDVIYLDIQTPVPLDFMGYQPEEKETLVGELKYILTRTIETQHAPLMNANLTDVLYTLFNYNENPATPPNRRATFLDISRFFTDATRQREIRANVTDRDLLVHWQNNFPKDIEISRITSRMTPFLRSAALRKIFGVPNPRLNV